MNAPHTFTYVSGTLSWTGDVDADEYMIIFQPTSGGDWCVCYMDGGSTSRSFSPGSGTYRIKGKSGKHSGGGSEEWTEWGEPEVVSV